MHLLGLDIGTSSVKATLIAVKNGQILASTHSPKTEMPVRAEHTDWAEQDPEAWWKHTCFAVKELLATHPTAQVQGIGIAYQMHGLVLVDEVGDIVRPAIIWSDSRSGLHGKEALTSLGKEAVFSRLLNAPGNFTASKLKWVQENEPEAFNRATHMMLPGDFIAFRMTGDRTTTTTGLSEGTLWDFSTQKVATFLLDHWGIPSSMIPAIVPTFGEQGKLSVHTANQLGLRPGIPITYRAGDQPNNALSLGVLHPGEIAATAGTSGVVYGVVDSPVYDLTERVNSFAHVNHLAEVQRIGVLLCINGAGSLYAWLRANTGDPNRPYPELEQLAMQVAVGSEGLRLLPFGNGAERVLNQQPVGAHLLNLHVRQHGLGHVYRAGLEGIAFAFAYGMKHMQKLGLDLTLMRVGNDNLFQSNIFAQTLSNLTHTRIEMRETSGARGAAIAAGKALYGQSYLDETLRKIPLMNQFEPQNNTEPYSEAYEDWCTYLHALISLSSQ